MAIVNDSQIIGNGTTDIVLNTRGKIYIKVNDRFYELNYKALASGANNTTIINNINPTEDLDLSNYVSKKYLKNTLEDFVTVRNWEDTMKTKEALENAKLEGFTESLTPITVNTMQMTVGNENLQFDFIGDLVRGTVVSGGLVIIETGLLRCPKTYIKHYTLDGPEKVKPDTDNKYYARWTIVPEGEEGIEYEDIPLDDDVDYYYVYLRVPTYTGITDEMVDNATEDIKGNKEGNWIISPNSIALDAEDGYYHLLTAIITGSGNNRSIGYLNGFTEILPGQIRAYVFSTPDGKQFLDFQREKFKLGNEHNFIDWNVTEKDTLTIKGNISVTGGELSDTLKNFAKKYNREIELWFSTFAPETQTTPTLQNWPYIEWESKAKEYGQNVDSVINSHLYDLYFDINDSSIYQFLKQKGEYKWINYSEIDSGKISELQKSLSSAYEPLNHLNTIYKKVGIIKDCIIKNPGLNSIIESITEKLQITPDDKNLISEKTETLSTEIEKLSLSIDNLLNNSKLDSNIIKLNVVKNYDAFKTSKAKLLEIIQEYSGWELTNIELGYIDGSLEEEYEKYAVIVNDFISKLLILQDAIDSANKNVNANINAEFAKYGQHGSYLEEALKQRTDIAGGLVLTSLIELGSSTKDPNDPNFYDGFTVKSGISGISKNDDNDVAFWSGGTYAQAIDTVTKYAENPTYKPTTEELASMAKTVITHGGRAILNDVIVRGMVYAKDGEFTGTVYAKDGEFTGKVNATTGSFSGKITAKEGTIGPFDINNWTLKSTSNGSESVDNKNYNRKDIIELSSSSLGVKSDIKDESGERVGYSQCVLYPAAKALFAKYAAIIENSVVPHAQANPSFPYEETPCIALSLRAEGANEINKQGFGGNFALQIEDGMVAGLRPRMRIITESGDYDLSDLDHTIVTKANNITINLRLPSEPKMGQTYKIWKQGSHTLKISPNGSQILYMGKNIHDGERKWGDTFFGTIELIYYTNKVWLMVDVNNKALNN